MTKRYALLGAVLALPIALLVLAWPPGARWAAIALAAPVVIGLVVLEPVLRRHTSEGTAFWTLVLGTYGTGLYPLLAHAPDAKRALAFLLGAIGVALIGRQPSSLRLSAFGVLLIAGAGLAPLHSGGAGVLRGLFGSRGGLLFETPLLWASVVGLVLIARRHERAALPLVVTGVLPFVVAGIAPGPLDVALPTLLVALAVGLEAACALVARRPGVAVALLAVVLAVSNLAFMQQYRYTLRRDDTVSFPQVSEGNARLVSRVVGSPVAWPANWIWSARHGLPVARWDLQSGQRLDPARGVTIDVGDLDQDAAFLLDGWSVRHECADAVCREIEGRAEMVVPLEQTPTRMTLRAAGPGSLRMALNGADLGPIALGPALAEVAVPASARWRRGPNRIVLEATPGTRALVDGARLQREEP